MNLLEVGCGTGKVVVGCFELLDPRLQAPGGSSLRLLLSGGKIILDPRAASSSVANVSDMSMFDSIREITGRSERADAAKSSPQSSSLFDASEASLPFLRILGIVKGNDYFL